MSVQGLPTVRGQLEATMRTEWLLPVAPDSAGPPKTTSVDTPNNAMTILSVPGRVGTPKILNQCSMRALG